MIQRRPALHPLTADGVDPLPPLREGTMRGCGGVDEEHAVRRYGNRQVDLRGAEVGRHQQARNEAPPGMRSGEQ